MDSKQQKALLQSVRASLLKVSPLQLTYVCVLFEVSIQSARAYHQVQHSSSMFRLQRGHDTTGAGAGADRWQLFRGSTTA